MVVGSHPLAPSESHVEAASQNALPEEGEGGAPWGSCAPRQESHYMASLPGTSRLWVYQAGVTDTGQPWGRRWRCRQVAPAGTWLQEKVWGEDVGWGSRRDWNAAPGPFGGSGHQDRVAPGLSRTSLVACGWPVSFYLEEGTSGFHLVVWFWRNQLT